MVKPYSNTHVDEEENGEPAHGLEVAREEGVGHRAEAEEKQDSGRGSHSPFIENGDVDTVDLFAKIKALFLGARHSSNIPQGVYREQGRVARRIR